MHGTLPHDTLIPVPLFPWFPSSAQPHFSEVTSSTSSTGTTWPPAPANPKLKAPPSPPYYMSAFPHPTPAIQEQDGRASAACDAAVPRRPVAPR